MELSPYYNIMSLATLAKKVLNFSQISTVSVKTLVVRKGRMVGQKSLDFGLPPHLSAKLYNVLFQAFPFEQKCQIRGQI